jgi:molybdate transport system substrate-binding protein
VPSPAPAASLAAASGELTVFAAASLKSAFESFAPAYQAETGLGLTSSFDASSALRAQIEQGAPADVFASADQRWMSELMAKGQVDGEPAVFARNRLVAIVPRNNPARIGALGDLARRGTKIVLAAEAVPVGKYSRETLVRLAGAEGFPKDYDRRVLANVVSQEENVKSVVAKVQLGEADGGIVYQSDVTPSVARYVRVFEIPDPYNSIATYPIAVLKSAGNAQAARDFLALVTSARGQAVLQRHGLLPAAAPAAEGARP